MNDRLLAIHQFILQLEKKRIGRPFASPVAAAALGLTDYHSIITHPMDLSTVKKHIANATYSEDPSQIFAELDLIWSNAILYNRPGSEVYEASVKCREASLEFELSFWGEDVPVSRTRVLSRRAYLDREHASASAERASKYMRTSTPTDEERTKLALKIRSLAENGAFETVNNALQTMWASHCHPADTTDASFVSRHLTVVNRYQFDVDALPDAVFWRVWSSIGL